MKKKRAKRTQTETELLRDQCEALSLEASGDAAVLKARINEYQRAEKESDAQRFEEPAEAAPADKDMDAEMQQCETVRVGRIVETEVDRT